MIRTKGRVSNPNGINKVEWGPGEIEYYLQRYESGEPLKGKNGLAWEKGCTHTTMRAALTGVSARRRRGTGPERLTDEQRNNASHAIERGECKSQVAERYGRTIWWANWVTYSYTRTDDGKMAGLELSKVRIAKKGGHDLPEHLRGQFNYEVREQIRRT